MSDQHTCLDDSDFTLTYDSACAACLQERLARSRFYDGTGPFEDEVCPIDCTEPYRELPLAAATTCIECGGPVNEEGEWVR